MQERICEHVLHSRSSYAGVVYVLLVYVLFSMRRMAGMAGRRLWVLTLLMYATCCLVCRIAGVLVQPSVAVCLQDCSRVARTGHMLHMHWGIICCSNKAVGVPEKA
jgi:hypothetical protein